MAMLTWDGVGSRTYETGVDRGVLYLSDGSGVAWNGLTSVAIKTENSSNTALFYDGPKSFDLVNPGDLGISLNAFTYPEEFNEYFGLVNYNDGVYVDNQVPKPFGLSYRTYSGDDVNGDKSSYKIHVLYNLTAVEDDISYETISDATNPINFSWSLTSTPVSVAGHRHTSHFIIDSAKTSPEVLSIVELALYGGQFTEPELPNPIDLLSHVNIVITDNGNGTWTATGPEYYITIFNTDEFEITNANAYYIASTPEALP
jgi:hypothetical protein